MIWFYEYNYTNAWTYTWGYSSYSGNVLWIGQDYVVNGTYDIYRSYVYFDTSILPDTINITSATLSLYGETDASTTDFNITIQNGQPTYPHDPLTGYDYNKAYYSGNGGNASTSGFSTSGYNNITLTSTGLTWISKIGTTKLCLRSNLDINGTEPSGHEYVKIHSKEAGESKAPKLYITYEVEGNRYILHGAYDEMGDRDGAINVTLYKSTESAETFELDGNATKEMEEIPIAFHFSLGYNQSRVYYVKDDFEEIYVFKPTEPYYTYYFTVVDFVGVTNGYIETLINVNGTNRIVERYSLEIVNEIPFIMSWGASYTIRLICDEGTHTWGSFVASATQEQTLLITPSMFPVTYPGLNVSVNATRKNSTWIQVNYTDSENLTSWVQIVVKHKYAHSWLTSSTQNNTGNTHQLNWYGADEDTDYYATVTAWRENETKTWNFNLPVPPSTTNPWQDALNGLGNWPIPSQNIIGLIIVLAVFALFSYHSMPVGCVLGVIMAAFLTAIGWLDLNWNLITLAGAIAVFAGISKAKRTEREI